jgi:ParB family chromosome partitioning protein
MTRSTLKTLDIHDLPITSIVVPANRARDYDEAGAQMLAGIIAAQGLHHPIRVRPTGDRYTLISGLMRLRAFELLQRDTIPASLSGAASDEAARLEEVMENLGRSELIALDRCHHLHELKRVWQAMHPGSTHGGDRKSIKVQSLHLDPSEPEVFGFAEIVAERMGLSRRTIFAAVKIWTGLTAASRLRLVGTKLATKQTELKALSEEPAPRQAKILDLILGDERPDIENVAAALAYLENGIQPTALERKFRALSDGIKALPDESLDLLLVENEERVIASLKRRGRI